MKTWRDYPILKKGEFSYRGTWDESLFKKSIGVVGARRMTTYGKQVIEKIIPDLIAKKVTIISGFMYGVDTYAHNECLKYGGKTIAVLGSGLNYLYPLENDKLYTEIITSGGLVLSTYPADFKPTLWSFPQRNKKIVELSTLGILVIEAGIKSGSLVTAKIANTLGKTIYAVPGPITSTVSEGTNWLIKNQLAEITTSSIDILPDISISSQLTINTVVDPILKLLETEALSADELSLKVNLSLPDLSVKLTRLSFQDLIQEENGKFYLVSKSNSNRLR